MKTADELANKIENLIRAHLEEVERTAAEAVTRSFAPRRKATPMQTRSRATAQRRATDELAALAERLLAEVSATPGETMAVLAERLGASVRELNRPMNNLRRAGRLRKVGARNQTRYFPTTKASRT
jgi:CRP-like cAMP-binding protein